MELESVRVQLEEESEARLDIERQLVKANGEVSVWRSKYETEANARIEEVINIITKILCIINIYKYIIYVDLIIAFTPVSLIFLFFIYTEIRED